MGPMFFIAINITRDPKFDNRFKCLKTINIGNLFTFLVTPARVSNWDFIYACFSLGKFNAKFDLNTEVITNDGDTAEQFGSDSFITGLGIRKIDIGK